MFCKYKLVDPIEFSSDNIHLIVSVLSKLVGVLRGKLVLCKAPELFSFRYRKDSFGSR